jgi:hypothetical protein
MNEGLQIFRNRLRGEKPVSNARFKVRDVVSMTISIIALTISAGLAYWNVVLQTDDVRLVLKGIPARVTMNKDRTKYSFYVPPSFTFINFGNRPAAIEAIYLTTHFSISGPLEGCDQKGEASISFGLGLTPVVLKSKDIAIIPVTLEFDPDIVQNFVVPYDDSPDFYTLNCLGARVVTPDEVFDDRKGSSVRLIAEHFSLKDGHVKIEGESFPWVRPPVKIVYRTGSIFDQIGGFQGR